jgi:acetoin utilization protein AcuB
MTMDPLTVEPGDPLRKAIDFLRRRDVRSIPVVQGGTLIGIVTDRDLRQVAPSYPLFRDEDEIRRYTENLKITAAMTADPMIISPDAPLVEAAKLLETYKFNALPVVRDQRLVGIITVTDILKVFIEQNQEVAHYEVEGDHGC